MGVDHLLGGTLYISPMFPSMSCSLLFTGLDANPPSHGSR
jgi:hypothetical protein